MSETYRDWRDFTDRVARPWLDSDDEPADRYYRTLMRACDPWYLACALVMADNALRRQEVTMQTQSESDDGCDLRGTA